MSRGRLLLMAFAFGLTSLALFVIVSTGCEEACLLTPFRLDTLDEIAEGLVIASIVAFFLISKPSVPSWLSRPIAPHFPRSLLVTLAVSGAIVYAIFAIIDATYYSFVSSYESGAAAFVVWGLTILFVAFRTGIINAFKIFGIPAIVFSMVIILTTNYLQMTSSISNLVQWDLNLRGWNYIPLVSNWSVLTIAVFLFGREVATRFQTVPVQPCSERCCPTNCSCGDCSACNLSRYARNATTAAGSKAQGHQGQGERSGVGASLG
ncbi:MAG: hypothetical protein OK456_11375 [Thaumarchaeota archaeon]|nr:hypothetical protein [Nitrososphaerota archaeon]